jgi:hypothetical protein
MSIAEFKERAVVTEFNTNNDWGFGGNSGKRYEHEGLTLEQGKRSYRHAKCQRYVLFYSEGNSLTKKEFEGLLSELG